MFGLLAGLYKLYFHPQRIQLLILGLDNAGKTTCLERWKVMYSKSSKKKKQLPTIVPTVGLNIAQFLVQGVECTIWDLGGQSNLRVIWDKYYSEASLIIYVVDSTDPSRANEARDELSRVLRHSELQDIAVLILANKQDKQDAVQAKTIRDMFALDELENPHECFGISALQGTGMSEAMQWVLTEVPGLTRTKRLEKMQ